MFFENFSATIKNLFLLKPVYDSIFKDLYNGILVGIYVYSVISNFKLLEVKLQKIVWVYGRVVRQNPLDVAFGFIMITSSSVLSSVRSMGIFKTRTLQLCTKGSKIDKKDCHEGPLPTILK